MEELDYKGILKFMAFGLFFLIGFWFIEAMQFANKKYLSLSWGLLLSGLIHFFCNKTVAVLYNSNPIGPKVTPKLNQKIGIIFILSSLGLFIWLIIQTA